MVSELRRREFLGRIGTVTAGGLLAAGTAGARGDGEAPPGNVETERVSIFAPPDDPKQVSTGTWLDHRFGWIDAYGESTEEDIERFLDAVELSVTIDGETFENPGQYWGEPRQNEDGDWIVWWQYVTPPKSPGVYEFEVVFHYPDGYEDGEDVREPGTREEVTGYYEVVPGGR